MSKVNYYQKLIEAIKEGKDTELLEYVRANIIRGFCPHMFFQDLDKIQCMTPKGTRKLGYSCERCWGQVIINKRRKKNEPRKIRKKHHSMHKRKSK